MKLYIITHSPYVARFDLVRAASPEADRALVRARDDAQVEELPEGGGRRRQSFGPTRKVQIRPENYR